MDEVFKQESEKYLTAINTALEDWGIDSEKSQAPEIIEKSLHSLKASARLMGYNDVADLTTPLEAMFEKFAQTGQILTSDEQVIIKDVLAGLNAGIVGDPFDTKSLIEELKKIKETVGEERYAAGNYEKAAQLFDEIISNNELEEFLTLRAYEHLG